MRSIATDSEKAVDFVVGFDEFTAVPRLDRVRLDVVGIDGVEDYNVIVSAVGGDREAASLIGEQLSFDVDHGHEDHVGFIVVGSLFVLNHVIECWGCLTGK